MSSPVDQPLPIRPLSSVPALSPAEPGLAVAQPLARALAAGLAVWAAGWAALLLLDGHIDLANQALLLVLAAAVAALWLPALAAVLVGTVSVLAFNWLFVPPRGTLAVDGRQNGLLLLAMLVLNTVVAGLMARLRHQASHARQHQQQAEQLRSLGDALRDSAEPLAHAGTLQAALASLLRAPVALLLCRDQPDAVSPALTNTGAIGGHPADTEDTNPSVMVLGQPDADETAGLWHCLRQGRAMGPGSGHHEALAHWYLPLRGRQASYSAAVLRLPAPGRVDEA